MKKYYLFFIAAVLVTILPKSELNAQNIKVYILAGQSNMEGQGQLYPINVNGTLSHFMASDQSQALDYIQNTDGGWATREDVWVRYDHGGDRGLLVDVLNVGLGEWEEAIGPELAFGHLLGAYHQEQVLIIKTCWGGKSLAVDFRPPSSGGTVGPYYNKMIADISTAIERIAVEFPQYTGGQVEIAGFCWFQGWNDGESEAYLNEYEQNLKNLIHDVRADLNTPDLPFVVGLTGNGGFERMENDGWILGLQTVLVPAQIRAAESTAFTNVAYAETRGFWREGDLSPEPDFLHHWGNNAESYLRIGNELGLKMIDILDQLSTSTKHISDAHKISLYPCPVMDYLQVDGQHPNYTLKICDVSGRWLETFTAISTTDTINVSTLDPGVYFVHIFDLAGEKLGVKKIIKQ